MTSELRNTLFSVIRCGMGTEKADLTISEETCRELMHFGSVQSILPIIYYGLKSLSVPKEFFQEYDKIMLKDVYNVIQRDESIRDISSVLSREGIQHILLKGAVLRNLYPHPDMRTSSDIDILVHEDEIDQAVQSIELYTDFKKQKRLYHDISMLSPQYHLELHFNIKENAENLDCLLGRAWDFAVPAGEGSIYAFTPEFQIFHVVAHMCHHFLHGGLGIRPFIDLWLLRNKTKFDEDSVRSLCSECGILQFYEASVRLSCVWLEKSEHTETTSMMEEFCLTGGVFGSRKFKNAARQHERRGIKYVLSRIFPPAYQVKEYYRDATGKKHTLPYYYIKRLVSWTGRSRRKKLKDQLHEILNSNQEYIDSAQELIRRLGLG